MGSNSGRPERLTSSGKSTFRGFNTDTYGSVPHYTMDAAQLLSSPRKVPALNVIIQINPLTGYGAFSPRCACVIFKHRVEFGCIWIAVDLSDSCDKTNSGAWKNLVTRYTNEGSGRRSDAPRPGEAVLLCDFSGNFGGGESIKYHGLFPKYATQERYTRDPLESLTAPGSAYTLRLACWVVTPSFADACHLLPSLRSLQSQNALLFVRVRQEASSSNLHLPPK